MTDCAPDLSIVIPAYNEEARLGWALPALADYLGRRQVGFELLVVDDGSTDGTRVVVEKIRRDFPMVRLLALNPNRGKGAAVKAGMLEARGDCVLFTDADQSTPITEIDRLLTALNRDDYDIAIGSRAVRGARVEQAQVWYRMLAGKLFGVATRLLAIRGIADTQCGFKLMRRDVARVIFPRVTSDSAIFDIELLIVATRLGYHVAEIPVKWVHDPDTRIPYNWRTALGIWRELWRIHRAHNLRGPLRARTSPRR